ncbi:uncharacterized protein [Pagrus major]|uniref:uncharacterized protein n=1 Tax=Pagrus major TaxID=143350 RepID=UPI003CC88BA6
MQLFIVLFLLSHVDVVTAVAGCHNDRDKDHRPRENCTAAGFSDVPAGIEPTTKVLLFPNNLFSSLSWSSFQMFQDIYEIDLSGNKVPDVSASVSPVLPSLSVLRLGSNRLTSLSDGAFSACPGLTELYLDANAIDTLSNHAFSGLSKLEILDLTSNHIKVLPPLMLHPLLAIETLYLENNKITVMPDGWFSQKEEVPYLYLSANPWACSCSLGYLRRYLDDNEMNVYVRDGPIIRSDGESVVCDSPQRFKGSPVLNLEESHLCSPATETGPTETGPTGDLDQQMTAMTPNKGTTAATTINYPPPAPTTHRPPPPTHRPPPPTHRPPPPPTHRPPPPTHRPTHRPPPPTHRPPPPTHRPPTARPPPPTHRPPPPTHRPPPPTHRPTHRPPPPTHRPPPPTHRPPTARPPPCPTESVPPTVTSTTPKVQVVTTTTKTPPWVIADLSRRQSGEVGAVGGAAVFCLWLLAGCVLLCSAVAACILTTLAGLVTWYRRVYQPLSVRLARRRRGGGEAVRLLTYSRGEVNEVAGGGVMEVYRSVLFIHREGGGAIETGGGAIEMGGDGGGEGGAIEMGGGAIETGGGAIEMGGDGGGEGGAIETGDGGRERLLVTLEPTGGGGGGGGGVTREEGREDRAVYRKTLFRPLSREEEVEGWRDVMEECRLPAEGGGRRGGGGVSRKRYSVILREEREESGGGREELDLVVGGWEAGGEEESLGDWLAQYLPSMPRAVATPPEGEAAQ